MDTVARAVAGYMASTMHVAKSAILTGHLRW